MPTRTRKLRHAPIRSPRTWTQKVRDAALVIFDVEQKDIALATGVERGTMTNIFRDRHRSPEAEQLVCDYLAGRWDALSTWERAALKQLGFKSGVTREAMGWPLPNEEMTPVPMTDTD